MPENHIIEYYSRRAREYEAIYAKPERQEGLSHIRTWLCEQFQGHDVLEIACGTGYWTERIAPVALSITAIDASAEVLDIARRKPLPQNRVHFQQADACNLRQVNGNFTAAFLGFWWSHVSRNEQTTFLNGLHQRVDLGGKVVMIDNLYVEGSSTPISRYDTLGNSYQLRRLADGSEHEVLKNFPGPEEFNHLLASSAIGITFRTFEYFWGVSYVLNSIQQ